MYCNAPQHIQERVLWHKTQAQVFRGLLWEPFLSLLNQTALQRYLEQNSCRDITRYSVETIKTAFKKNTRAPCTR